MTHAHSLIQVLERQALHSLPALTQRYFDGWLLRFNEGYTRRANAVYPLYSAPAALEDAIQHCEAQYSSAHLPVVFKMTPAAQPPHLDALLERRHYARSRDTLVQTVELRDQTLVPRKVTYEAHMSLAWLRHYLTWLGLPSARHTIIQQTLERVPGPRMFTTLYDEAGEPVSIGLAVYNDSWCGFFDITTAPDHRGRGYARLLMQYLMAWGHQQGARQGYLQVDSANEPALSVYQKLGFTTAYPYWYRERA